jgi:phosphatidylglycerophosphate synthase
VAAPPTYQPADRRPIASRERPLWRALAGRLAAHNVSPNAISIFGMLSALAGGGVLASTRWVDVDGLRRAGWLAAAAAVQLRLIANMLDGMVAVASGKASAVGELYNELPDRASDIAVLLGVGYAVGGSPMLGALAACAAVLTAYVRAVGKTCGTKDLFVGPMAKPHRMFAVTLLGLWMALTPPAWQPVWQPTGRASGVGIPAAVLALIIIGCVLTCYRRLARIVCHLRKDHP